MKTGKNRTKALLLFSGGLDSILAAKILEKQGIEVTALTFVSHFFNAEQAKKSAKENCIKLRIENFSDKHFKIIQEPKFGRGAGMNPCIDCHLLMLRIAKKIMLRDGFDFIATGEVLGQRPMSQNIQALKLIEKKAGLVGKIIRPLSENIIHPRAELLGGMYGISGRSRKEQMRLAKKFGIKTYPSPAGGCVLTEKEYSKKLRELLEKNNKPKASDIELLKIGRHFWSGKVKIIIGRNHEENLKLESMTKKGDTLVDLKNIPGPLALVRGLGDSAAIKMAKDKIRLYAKNAEGETEFRIRGI
jgi:tRNA-uridine 2-sulfurtransferase